MVPGLTYSVSATTRAPRAGEVDGRDYLFLTREEFEERIREGWFLEWAEYSGNLYGTPEHRIEELLGTGLSVILEIELQGARKVREKRPEAVMIFVQAPSLEETRKRLEGRATEDEKALEARMTTALTEVSAKEEFDYEVINSDRWQAREGIIRIMRDIVEGGAEDVE